MKFSIECVYGADGLMIWSNGESILIGKEKYDQFVTELEAKARELWPEKFKLRTLQNRQDEFLLQHNDDGSTDMVEIRKSDKINREQQIPIGSRRG